LGVTQAETLTQNNPMSVTWDKFVMINSLISKAQQSARIDTSG
jgi:hypothetical protein